MLLQMPHVLIVLSLMPQELLELEIQFNFLGDLLNLLKMELLLMLHLIVY
jgi:hypothetical protein